MSIAQEVFRGWATIWLEIILGILLLLTLPVVWIHKKLDTLLEKVEFWGYR